VLLELAPLVLVLLVELVLLVVELEVDAMPPVPPPLVLHAVLPPLVLVDVPAPVPVEVAAFPPPVAQPVAAPCSPTNNTADPRHHRDVIASSCPLLPGAGPRASSAWLRYSERCPSCRKDRQHAAWRTYRGPLGDARRHAESNGLATSAFIGACHTKGADRRVEHEVQARHRGPKEPVLSGRDNRRWCCGARGQARKRSSDQRPRRRDRGLSASRAF
jgi:hypothetical protein